MTNTVDSFINFLETINHYATITVDSFLPESNAIKVTNDPSRNITVPFIDGSYITTQAYTIMCRHENKQTALEQCFTFYNALQNTEIETDEGVQIRTLSITRPSFIAETETGESDYAFTVEIEMFKEL